MAHSMTGRVLIQSFKNWGSKDPKYKKLYKKLCDGAFAVITEAFTEIQVHKPGTWDMWWAEEHMRFKGIVKAETMRLVHELLYVFLTKYSRGELANARETTVRSTEPATVTTGKKALRKTGT